MTSATNNLPADSNFAFTSRSDTLLAMCFLMTLVTLVIPLPTFLLDMLLALNLGGSILLLLITMNSRKPLDLSVFPSLLLLTTLFRLSLNVASTRLILLNGDAGKIVSTFGDFVVGGNLIVGVVIFAILVTIQFIVITKGASRISEVNARFTLDAMPGKQMSIDAELNMGAIDEKEATRRRHQLAREAEFFGAMDGASKYVRGDAIAGLVILAVNILGGVTIGLMNGLPAMEALRLYSVLTIGDGLVSQIPALVIAMAAGILVTKSGSNASLGDDIRNQFSAGWQSLTTGAVVLLAVSFTPGFPKFPFWLMAIGLAVAGQRIRQSQMEARKAPPPPVAEPAPPEEQSPEERNLNRFLQNDRIRLEVGANLEGLIEPKQGRSLASRITTLRDEMATKYGFWIPRVRICGNLSMEVGLYRLMINGREVGKGTLHPGQLLAINPAGTDFDFPGEATVDPAFGFPARWIDESSQRRASLMGLTVVEPSTVLVTHLGECLRAHADELLSREDLQKMLVRLKETAPTIVEEIRPDIVRPSVLHQVLRNLLAEQVPITSLESILEAVIQHGPGVKDADELTERVRTSVGHLVLERFKSPEGRARIVCLDGPLNEYLAKAATGTVPQLKPHQLQALVTRLRTEMEQAALRGEQIALAVEGSLRRQVRQMLVRSLPEIHVIAFSEIPGSMIPDMVAVIPVGDVIESTTRQPLAETAASHAPPIRPARPAPPPAVARAG